MRTGSREHWEMLAKQEASEQNPVHELLREAVDQKIALWQTLRELEKTLGVECDSFEDIIEEWAAPVDHGSDINPTDLDELVKELKEIAQAE